MARASRLGRAALFTLALSGYTVAAYSRVDSSSGGQAPATPAASRAADARAMLDTYCVTCHNQRLKTAGLMLDTADVTSPHRIPKSGSA